MLHAASILQWYLDAGIDECMLDEPVNRLRMPEPVLPPPAAASIADTPAPARALKVAEPAANPFAQPLKAPSQAIADARAIADRCATREALEAAVKAFDGCQLKKTAMNTVFSDGNPAASVIFIGEAPGAQEDMRGIPFCGPSGALLDKMLAAIGHSRAENAYITNTVFWRPPGNRAPNSEELAVCEPFVEKHIALLQPKLLVLLGGVATTAILKRDTSVSRLRGRFYDYTNIYMERPVQAMVTFHPSYLLRTPAQKRLAWQDMQLIRDFLKNQAVDISQHRAN